MGQRASHQLVFVRRESFAVVDLVNEYNGRPWSRWPLDVFQNRVGSR